MREDIDEHQENIPDFKDPVFPNILDKFWEKIDVHKKEAIRITRKKRKKKEKE